MSYVFIYKIAQWQFEYNGCTQEFFDIKLLFSPHVYPATNFFATYKMSQKWKKLEKGWFTSYECHEPGPLVKGKTTLCWKLLVINSHSIAKAWFCGVLCVSGLDSQVFNGLPYYVCTEGSDSPLWELTNSSMPRATCGL